MRIACPVCAAAYEVPDERVGAGKTVRCVRCSSDWVARPAPLVPEPAPEPALEPTAVPEFDPEPDPDRPPLPLVTAPAEPPAAPVAAEAPAPVLPAATPARRGINWLPIAWGGSVALVLGGLVLLVVERQLVVTAWPPAQRLFAALGLAPT